MYANETSSILKIHVYKLNCACHFWITQSTSCLHNHLVKKIEHNTTVHLSKPISILISQASILLGASLCMFITKLIKKKNQSDGKRTGNGESERMACFTWVSYNSWIFFDIIVSLKSSPSINCWSSIVQKPL